MKNLTIITILTLILTNVPFSLAADPNIIATIDINPNSLKLTSKGNWITCYIWLPEGYNVADIAPDTLLLEDEIEAEWMWFDEENQIAMAKFSRLEVQQWLINAGLSGDDVELTVSGETQILGPGAVAVIPSNTTHSGRSVTSARIIDVFHPVREDYR